MSALASESISQVTAALIDAKADFRPALKDATNPHFQSKFVSLNGVLDAIGDALQKHRIAVVQQTDVTEQGNTVLVTRLIHESGEWLAGVYPVRPVKNDPQSEGSALTYARRYALMSLVGIAPEDDDGNAGSQARSNAEQARRDTLRNEIGSAAMLAGLNGWSAVADDFAAWSLGTPMADATEQQLVGYRDYLRNANAA